jgi:hypothetical protein
MDEDYRVELYTGLAYAFGFGVGPKVNEDYRVELGQ